MFSDKRWSLSHHRSIRPRVNNPPPPSPFDRLMSLIRAHYQGDTEAAQQHLDLHGWERVPRLSALTGISAEWLPQRGQTCPCVQSSSSADALLCLTWTEHSGAEPQQSEQQQHHRPSHGPPGTPATMSDTAWTKAATSSICFQRGHTAITAQGSVLWTGIVFWAETSEERASSRLWFVAAFPVSGSTGFFF